MVHALSLLIPACSLRINWAGACGVMAVASTSLSDTLPRRTPLRVRRLRNSARHVRMFTPLPVFNPLLDLPRLSGDGSGREWKRKRLSRDQTRCGPPPDRFSDWSVHWPTHSRRIYADLHRERSVTRSYAPYTHANLSLTPSFHPSRDSFRQRRLRCGCSIR